MFSFFEKCFRPSYPQGNLKDSLIDNQYYVPKNDTTPYYVQNDPQHIQIYSEENYTPYPQPDFQSNNTQGQPYYYGNQEGGPLAK